MYQYLNYIEKKLGIILLLLIGSIASINAQGYVVNLKHWTIEDGLSHRQVNTIFQDKDGLIWIGAKNGLNSFDGYEFKHWLGKQSNVETRNIHRIGQDDEGWLWLQRQDNLIFYHPKKGTFKTIEERFGKACPLLKNSASHFVNGFIVDDFGRIYYEKYNSNILYSYHSTEGFVKMLLPKPLKYAYSHLVMSSDKLTLEIIYGSTGKIVLKRKDLTTNFNIKTILLFDKNHQAVPTDYKTLIQKYKRLNNYKTLVNPNKTYWFIDESVNKFTIYNNNNEQIATISSNDYPELKNGYFGKNIFDKNDKLWLSSAFGFYTIDLTKEYFDFLPSPIFGNKVLPVRDITMFNDEIIAAFEPGFAYAYDASNQQWKFKKKGNWLKSFYTENKSLWTGSHNFLTRLEGNKETHIDLYKLNNRDFYDVWCIESSLKNKNILWIGTQRGLVKFDKSTQKSVPYKQTNNLIAFNNFHIQSIIYDKKNPNHLWLCTNKGLILMDEKKGFLKIYNQDNKENSFLPSTSFQHLYQDKDSSYWLATAGEGLIKWQPETNDFQIYSITNGFANEVIYAIYEDDFNNLWMSSDYGIMKMNKSSFNVENYLLENGIGQIEFNRISHFQAKDGTIYFGGLKGVTRFHPKDFQKNINQKISTLILSDFQQFNGNKRKIEQKTVETKNTLQITLRPSDYIYDLKFSVLSYDNSNKNQYIYQFSEHGKTNNNWQIQKSRSIKLGQLPYGNHTLTVRGKDAFGNDCENEIILIIKVLKPFYLQFWFIALLISFTVCSIYYYIKLRTRNFEQQQQTLKIEIQKATQKIQEDKETIETQAEELKKLDKLKSTFFANVSHELRTPLTLMLAPIKSVIKRANLDNRSLMFLKTAEQNGHRLLGLVNEILDLNKLEAGKLEIKKTTVAFYPFIKRIASYFMSYSEDTGVLFYFNYQLERDIHLEFDTKKVETIVNNLLSNAFKFTQKGGQIDIDICDKNHSIAIIIKDTGQGIHPNDLPNIFNRFYQSKEQKNAEGGTGIGLALSKELAKLIGGDLTVESQLEKGSIFQLTFPRKEVLKTMSNTDYYTSNLELKSPSIPHKIEQSIITKKKSTILIVEDNSGLQNYLKAILEEIYLVIIAENGQIALNILQQTPTISLIVSDIMMPIMDGYQFLKSVKENDKFRHLPIIMLTARAAKSDKLTALRIGVDDYILKPFDEDELLVRINNLLNNAQLRTLAIENDSEKQGNNNENTLSKSDIDWLTTLENVVHNNIETKNFTTEILAHELAISRRQLSRKVKLLTGLTPNKYITTVRLQTARELLMKEPNLTVKEVSYRVGFLKTEYFSKLFTVHFGKRPSEI